MRMVNAYKYKVKNIKSLISLTDFLKTDEAQRMFT